LCGKPPIRIGLSATQKPIDEGRAISRRSGQLSLDDGQPRCQIIDTGMYASLDLAIEVPPSGIVGRVPSETWQEIYARLSELIRTHRSTLVFVNNRRLAERVTHYLEEQLGEGKWPAITAACREKPGCGRRRRPAQDWPVESDRCDRIAGIGH